MTGRQVLLIAVVFVLSGVVAGAVGSATASGDTPAATSDEPAVSAPGSADQASERSVPPALPDLEPDSVVIEVVVREDGTALWTIEYRSRLDDSNATAAFESTREKVETAPLSLTGPFRDDMETAAKRGSEETGRRMSVGNVSVEAERRNVPEEFGIVAFTFEWTGFATVDDGEIRAGPVLSDFPLTNSTTLLVAWPRSYERTDASPDPDQTSDRSVTWDGPREFAPGEPLVVAETTAESSLPLVPIGASLLVLAGATVGATLLVRRSTTTAEPEPAPGDDVTAAEGEPARADVDHDTRAGAERERQTGTKTESQAGVDSQPQSARRQPEADETPAGSSGGGGEPSEPVDAVGGATGESEETLPSELLSNEERVLELLEQRGGRMKQQAVVDAFDWSETKTSQVVNDLREGDRIEVYRIGRENVLALPGEMDV